MTTERIKFAGAFGDQLAARIELPDGDDAPRAYALFAHCFTCSKDLKPVHALSRALTDHGLGVMRFDFTGLGESAGDFADTNFSSNVDDLVAAAAYLRESYRAPSLLIGHSLGGLAALAVAGRIGELRAVATIGAPCSTGHLAASIDGAEAAAQAAPGDKVDVSIAGRAFALKRQFFDDLKDWEAGRAHVQALSVALLVMHSPADQTVELEHARRIYDAAHHPKSFVSLDDYDHLLLSRAATAGRYVGNVIAAWADRYQDA